MGHLRELFRRRWPARQLSLLRSELLEALGGDTRLSSWRKKDASFVDLGLHARDVNDKAAWELARAGNETPKHYLNKGGDNIQFVLDLLFHSRAALVGLARESQELGLKRVEKWKDDVRK